MAQDSAGSSVNPEQAEALQHAILDDSQDFLDRIARRDNLESGTTNNEALTRLVDAKVKVRVMMCHVAVFACGLAAAWTLYLFITL